MSLTLDIVFQMVCIINHQKEDHSHDHSGPPPFTVVLQGDVLLVVPGDVSDVDHRWRIDNVTHNILRTVDILSTGD